MHFTERITVKPEVCHGRACISGTRMMVAVILDNLAAGLDKDELLKNYPSLTVGDSNAALSYVATINILYKNEV